ncbi:hypothetical protein PF005_g29028 [Phytophthora fragariae]|uniref:Pectate lyase domain-containing protein n=1 Tax=Phytophthora fragariae TaxID=53985 RepID=A0A6A3VKF6_9STRA|nr:hypothetical protein PF005_g29028 [Phytophthora fragariae]
MYDLAGNSNPLIASLVVSSSKTLRNLGTSGTITDKDCLNGNNNVVTIQNILITQLNPHHSLGGGAI